MGARSSYRNQVGGGKKAKPPCKLEHCDKHTYKRGLCSTHFYTELDGRLVCQICEVRPATRKQAFCDRCYNNVSMREYRTTEAGHAAILAAGRRRLAKDIASGKQRLIRWDSKAKRLAAFVEAVHPNDVWDKDDGLCHLCAEPCDPLDFHMDHVVPIALGGKHCLDNVALAHPICNLRKNARILSKDENRLSIALQACYG